MFSNIVSVFQSFSELIIKEYTTALYISQLCYVLYQLLSGPFIKELTIMPLIFCLSYSTVKIVNVSWQAIS